ncbi:hypothetical protein [Arthrobacter sp. B1805]|uniref:hypothetical protein n=1 Tax=Arthrobacter sp. B1805 TaxID=2058892 RepID=UPI0011B0590A|nr:hypothetical protein [Arthrobacter sp. B1805]
MKKLSFVACALLLTGCTTTSSDGAVEGGNQSEVASPTSAAPRTAVEEADAATCQTLIGADGGLISDSAEFLTNVSEMNAATATEAARLAGTLEGVADTSSARFRNLLTVMQEPFHDLEAAYENGRRFSLNPDRFKSASKEVIALCEPLM